MQLRQTWRITRGFALKAAATDAALGKLSGLKKGGKRARQAELDDEDGALSSDDGEEAEAPAPAPAKRRSTA